MFRNKELIIKEINRYLEVSEIKLFWKRLLIMVETDKFESDEFMNRNRLEWHFIKEIDDNL